MVIPIKSKHPILRIIILPGIVIATLPGTPLISGAQQTQRIEALCDSGFVLLEKEEFDKAHDLFRGVLRLDRDSPRGLLGMGRALLGLPKGGGRALEYLRRAVDITPDDPNAHYYKALAHIQLARTDLFSRNSGMLALQELEEVITINPSHSDAYYMRGQIYRDTFEDYAEAINAFRLQIEISPSHMEARLALIRAEMDVGDWDAALEEAEGIITRDPDQWEVYPWLAAAQWKAGRPAEAMRSFERYFGIAPEEERNLYFDLNYVLTPADQKTFTTLDNEGKRTFWNNYWRSRDPDPKTIVNERLVEHFIRIAYARLEFSKSKWPWDARGNFMIRYGEPEERLGPGRPFPKELIDDWDFYLRECDIADQMGLPRPRYSPGRLFTVAELGFDTTVDGSGTRERWIYTSRGIDVSFDNPVMSGNYLNSSPALVEAMGRRMPVLSEEEDKIETFDPLQSAVTFRGSDGRTALEYAIGLFSDDIGQFRSLTGEYAYIDARLDLHTTDWRPVAGASDTVSHIALRPQIQIRGNPMFVHGTRVEVDPGDYIFSVLIMDAETGKRSTSQEEVTLPDYSGSNLMISDILPAARITEVGPGRTGRFIRDNLEVIPLPGRNLAKDQTLFIYFEVYNLNRDPFGATRYKVEYSVAEGSESEAPILKLYQGLKSLVGFGRKQAVLSSESELSGIRRDISSYLEIDMSGPDHGVYTIRVRITDLVSGEEAVSGITFRTLPPVPR